MLWKSSSNPFENIDDVDELVFGREFPAANFEPDKQTTENLKHVAIEANYEPHLPMLKNRTEISEDIYIEDDGGSPLRGPFWHAENRENDEPPSSSLGRLFADMQIMQGGCLAATGDIRLPLVVVD